MPYTIDPDTIRQSITELSDWSARHLQQDQRERAVSLTRLALVRPILYTHSHQLFPRNLIRIETDRFQPQWIAEARRAGQTIYAFNPTDKTRSQINAVADWIVQSIEDKAPWLAEMDSNARPRSLTGFHSLDHAAYHAQSRMAAHRPLHQPGPAEYRAALAARSNDFKQTLRRPAPEQDNKPHRDRERD